MSIAYGYDWGNRLTSLVNDARAADLARAYTHDDVGNRRTMTADGAAVHAYTYDAAYRLTGVDYPSGFFRPDTTFAYDAADNRTSVHAGYTITYIPNSLRAPNKMNF